MSILLLTTTPNLRVQLLPISTKDINFLRFEIVYEPMFAGDYYPTTCQSRRSSFAHWEISEISND
jgi:hypothetical protein